MKKIIGEFEKLTGIDLGDMGKRAKDAFGNIVDFIEKKVVPIVRDSLLPALGDIVNFAVDTLIPALGKIAGWIIDVGIPALQAYWHWWQENVLPVLKAVALFVVDEVIPALVKIVHWIQTDGIPALKDLWHFFETKILPVLKSVANFVIDDLVPALQKIGSFITDKVIPALKDLWTWVNTHIVPILKDFWKITSDLFSIFGDVAGIILKVAGPVYLGALKLAFELVKPAIEPLKLVVSTVFGAASKVIGDAIGVVKNLVEGVKDLVKWLGSIKAPHIDWPSVPSWVPGFGGGGTKAAAAKNASGGSFYNPQAKLADGDLVTGPKVVLVGEAGPELILPLTRPGRMQELLQLPGISTAILDAMGGSLSPGLSAISGSGSGISSITLKTEIDTSWVAPITQATDKLTDATKDAYASAIEKMISGLDRIATAVDKLTDNITAGLDRISEAIKQLATTLTATVRTGLDQVQAQTTEAIGAVEVAMKQVVTNSFGERRPGDNSTGSPVDIPTNSTSTYVDTSTLAGVLKASGITIAPPPPPLTLADEDARKNSAASAHALASAANARLTEMEALVARLSAETVAATQPITVTVPDPEMARIYAREYATEQAERLRTSGAFR